MEGQGLRPDQGRAGQLCRQRRRRGRLRQQDPALALWFPVLIFLYDAFRPRTPRLILGGGAIYDPNVPRRD